jgi:MOSC domain-containing protein YiiM
MSAAAAGAAEGAPDFIWGSESAALSRVLPSRVSAPGSTRGSDSASLARGLRSRACTGTIHSINVSLKKGEPKTPVAEAEIVAGEGIRGDAHRGFGHRQVSLLTLESIEEQKRMAGGEETARAAGVAIVPGVFAENLTTRGIDLSDLRIGDELVIRRGRGRARARLRVSQIGKECYTRCAIFQLAGDCIMPERGVFCEVVAGGTVRTGDRIEKR